MMTADICGNHRCRCTARRSHQGFAHRDLQDINSINTSKLLVPSQITRFLGFITFRTQDPLKFSHPIYNSTQFPQPRSLSYSLRATQRAVTKMSDLLGFGHIAISSTSLHISIHHDRQHGPTTLGIFLRELCGVRDREIEEQQEWAKRERQHRRQQWAEGMHRNHTSQRKTSSLETNKSCVSCGSGDS